MTNQELLAAVSDLMDQKLNGLSDSIDQKLNGLSDSMDQKLNGLSDSMDQKLNRLSDDMNQRFASVDERLKRIELRQENDILPRLQNIEVCYTSTYWRYQAGVEQIDAMQADIDVMKQVLKEHGEKLQKLA